MEGGGTIAITHNAWLHRESAASRRYAAFTPRGSFGLLIANRTTR